MKFTTVDGKCCGLTYKQLLYYTNLINVFIGCENQIGLSQSKFNKTKSSDLKKWGKLTSFTFGVSSVSKSKNTLAIWPLRARNLRQMKLFKQQEMGILNILKNLFLKLVQKLWKAGERNVQSQMDITSKGKYIFVGIQLCFLGQAVNFSTQRRTLWLHSANLRTVM